jgi:hypothetical protein
MKKFILKITPKKITFWFYFFIVLASLTVFSYISMFLYQSLYKTITQSEEIVILKEKVAIETINMKKYETIIDRIKEKNIARQIRNYSNPFD